MNANQSNQLVIFRVGEERFGVDIASVREIIRLPRVTHLPLSTPVLEGIVNFRGQTAPVLNLRARLGIEVREQRDGQERLLVVSCADKTYALLVDAVDAVERFEAREIEPLSGVLSTANEYVLGMIKRGEKILLLLDLPGALGLAKAPAEEPIMARALQPTALAGAQEPRNAPAYRSAA